jgi:phenylacetate-CoA ligase
VAKKKYGPAFIHWSTLLKESQYYNSVELEALQVRLLNDFIKSAVNNSKYYRNIAVKNGLDMDKLLDLKSVKKFPVINKALVKENYDDILNKLSAKYKFSSSGTTGTSLHVYLDEGAYQREYAFRWHFFSVAGASRKDKFAYFLGNSLFPLTHTKPPFHIIDPYENSIYFSIFHMSDNTLIHYTDAFNKFKAKYLKGYPSGLCVFADFIKRKKIQIHKIEAIFSASETLHEEQNNLLEEVFQCNVYQWYGQVETTVNIHECEYHNLHVKEEYGYLELLNDKGEDAKPGEIANAVGTGWGNTALPLIRYDTGDNMILAENQHCRCGRTGRIIEKIVGRDEDTIITPDGKKIGRLDFVFKPIETVIESQIIQETFKKIIVKVVPSHNFSQEDSLKIIKILKDYIGSDMSIKIEKVDRIERNPNGKIRYVISKVRL